MKITPDNIIYHELIGLKVEVIKSTDPTQVGVCGTVIDETKNMLVILEESGRIKKIPKKNCSFKFYIPQVVIVNGKDIIYDPAERLKRLQRRKVYVSRY
jgi:ribonuclease P protein subunit POP4